MEDTGSEFPSSWTGPQPGPPLGVLAATVVLSMRGTPSYSKSSMSIPQSLGPSPSPPSASQPRSPSRVWWAAVGLSVLLFVSGGPDDVSHPLLQLGLPLLLIVGLVSWRVWRWRQCSGQGRSALYWLDVAKKMWRPRGSGFYALVAGVTFLGLQARMLLARSREMWETWREVPFTDGGAFVDFLSGQLWNGIFEVSMAASLETILNVVWAGLWPLFWLQRYDLAVALGTILLIYAVYRGARRRFPGFDAVMHHVDVTKETDRASEETQAEPERGESSLSQTVAGRVPRKHDNGRGGIEA